MSSKRVLEEVSVRVICVYAVISAFAEAVPV